MTELYDPKDPLETVVCSMDFTVALGGETSTDCVVDVFRADLAAEDTTAMVVGSVDTSSAPIMRQKISGGTHGVNYVVRFKVTTAQRVVTGSAYMLVKKGA